MGPAGKAEVPTTTAVSATVELERVDMTRFGKLGLLVVLLTVRLGGAADQPQWGQRWTRNMVSDETGLVTEFDIETGQNVKWVAEMGSETWATPVIAKGRVFIGTNNHSPRDRRHKGDRALLLCLDERDGRFLWQLVVPKLGPDPYLDWPRSGVVSPVTVEGNRAYVVTNRGEAVCLDIEGQANGNDGPYMDEARHMVPEGEPPLEVTDIDADILWLYDIPNQAGTYPHDAAHASILIDGGFLYINTSNGVDNTHKRIRRPDGPSLIVLHKTTGRLLARDREGIGPRIFHSTWSSPALGFVQGRKLVFFAGGDGVIYAFEALQDVPPAGTVETLKCLWRFDGDPNAPKENVSEYLRNREVSPSNIKSMPVLQDGRLYITLGGDIWWGKRQAWLQCIDVAAGPANSPEPELLWSHKLSQHCSATPAIYDGLAFVADCGRLIHCVDAGTGEVYWTHETKGDMWASPLVADGKVYIGTRRKDFWVLAAARRKDVLSMSELDSPIASCAMAANGVLYVTTMRKLYALAPTMGTAD
jgi:outer membrane protein assembly factor BamB